MCVKMGRETFKIWMDEIYERESLLVQTELENDAEYELLTLEEDEDKWLGS